MVAVVELTVAVAMVVLVNVAVVGLTVGAVGVTVSDVVAPLVLTAACADRVVVVVVVVVPNGAAVVLAVALLVRATAAVVERDLVSELEAPVVVVEVVGSAVEEVLSGTTATETLASAVAFGMSVFARVDVGQAAGPETTEASAVICSCACPS